MKPLLLVIALLFALTSPAQNNTADPLSALVQLLDVSEDPQFQLDILKGMSDGLKGRRGVKMPQKWDVVEKKLSASPNAQVRELAKSLSVTFGSQAAFTTLRATLLDANAGASARSNALSSLLAAKDPELAPALQKLLADPVVRGGALRALATYDDPLTPAAILNVYPSLVGTEKAAAIGTLSARPAYAKALLAAVADGKVPRKDLTADVVRQLRNFKDQEINAQVAKNWGVARDSEADKLKEIARFKALAEAKGFGDPGRGRAVFTRTCQQCHTLYGEGGKVGPEITGSDRGNLDYILQNIIDPNAVIPNDYRTWNLETTDDRSITGIVTKQDSTAVTIVTATETILVPRKEVQSLSQSELSMMPEGLLQALTEREVLDLLGYLRTTAQVPATAGAQ